MIHTIPTIVVCLVLTVVVYTTGCVSTDGVLSANKNNENLYEGVYENSRLIKMVPTSRKTGSNLFRRVKDWKKQWIYRPVHSQPSNNSTMQKKTYSPSLPQDEQKTLEVKTKLSEEPRKNSPFEGNRDIEEATRRIEDALKAGRNEQK